MERTDAVRKEKERTAVSYGFVLALIGAVVGSILKVTYQNDLKALSLFVIALYLLPISLEFFRAGILERRYRAFAVVFGAALFIEGIILYGAGIKVCTSLAVNLLNLLR